MTTLAEIKARSLATAGTWDTRSNAVQCASDRLTLIAMAEDLQNTIMQGAINLTAWKEKAEAAKTEVKKLASKLRAIELNIDGLHDLIHKGRTAAALAAIKAHCRTAFAPSAPEKKP